jgi:dTDP-4-amino-4,6-dideoxygalactose transaminase
VSAFSFPCQKQGPLADALVVDCSDDGFLDREAVASVPDAHFDGLIVTNLFGGAADIGAWTKLARGRGKRLIFDSAAAFLSTSDGIPLGRWGDGEAFSFHHTKPCGVGEGGCVVVPSEHEDAVRSLINFGRYSGINTGPFSMNGKLSDIAAAFILDRLRSALRIRDVHRAQWRRIVDVALRLHFEVLGDPDPGFPSLAAVLAPEVTGAGALDVGVVALSKHYRPLVAEGVTAQGLFDRVVCWPCHSEIANLSSQKIEEIFEAILRRSRGSSTAV